MLDLEDNPSSIVARLRIIGARDDEIADRFIYIRPTAPFGPFELAHLVTLVEERGVSLVIIDSLGEAFGLDGTDENADVEVGPWMRRIPRRLADAGPAVINVDHSTKANDNPLFPSGSKRKRAAITGAMYLLTATVPLQAGSGGRLRLTCAKDRHGTYARGEHAADLVMRTDPSGTRIDLYAPDNRGPVDLPLVLAARAAVKVAKDIGGDVTFRVLRESMTGKVKASNEVRTAGIELAVSRGALAETTGARRARVFHYVAELPEDDPHE